MPYPAPLDTSQGNFPPKPVDLLTVDDLRLLNLLTSEQRTLTRCWTGPLRRGAGGASFRPPCRNRWSCPSCSPYRLRQDANTIADVALSSTGAVFATFTLQHRADAPLAQTLDALGEVWDRAFGHGTWWPRFKNSTGLLGWVRVIEITNSAETGWHPHLHAVLVFGKRPTTSVVDDLRTHWTSTALGRGYTAHVRDQVADIVPIGPGRERVAYYATKSNALRRSAPDDDGETMADLAARFQRTGDVEVWDRVREYQEATHGRSKVTFSRGFAALATAPRS